VQPDTFFVHDRRFERLQHPGMPRRFRAFAYWHLKHLKPEFGFANYDLASNPGSRYVRRLVALKADHAVMGTAELARAKAPGLGGWLADRGMPAPARDRIIAARARAARELASTPLEALLSLDAELAPFLTPDSA
jgi:hypothetical protein